MIKLLNSLPPLISVIIPTCNRNEQLASCLDQLAPGMQTLDSNLYEVIISDDSVQAAAKPFVEQYYSWARFCAGPGRGPAANRNRGVSMALGKWLVFTDDDCLPEKDWLQRYVAAITTNPSCKAFEGAILPDNWDLLKKDMAECPVNDKGGCFWSANIMVQHDLFVRIGGFDEHFEIAAQEDQDLFKSILLQEEKVIYLDAAIVQHPVRILPLKRKISMINQGILNWYYYHCKYHHDKNWRIRTRQIRLHLKVSFESMLSGKPKKSRLHFIIASRFLFIKLIPK